MCVLFSQNAKNFSNNTPNNNKKGASKLFREFDFLFANTMRNLIEKINNKKAQIYISTYLKILILIVVGALMITLTIMLYTQVIRPNLADRASTMISQAPHVEYSIET